MHTKAYSEPGGASPNEDWFYAADGLAIVLDGATVRTGTGCVHGVPWYVENLGAAIIRRSEDPQTPLQDALEGAIEDVTSMHTQCDLSHPGTPSAAVGIVRIDSADEWRWLVLGDVTMALETMTDDVVVVSDERVSATAAAARADADREPIGSSTKQAAMIRMKHDELAARNRPGGYWIAAADPRAAAHAITGHRPAGDIRRTLVCSDGLTRALRMVVASDWCDLLDLVDRVGPAEVIHRIRTAERSDPLGLRWPRNKVSDDATVVLLCPNR